MDSYNIGNDETIMLDALSEQVERAIMLLDDDVNAEYKQAVAHDASFVKRESPIADYLRCEEYHTLRAANRLAWHWKRRKEYFEDRWLRPMAQVSD